MRQKRALMKISMYLQKQYTQRLEVSIFLGVTRLIVCCLLRYSIGYIKKTRGMVTKHRQTPAKTTSPPTPQGGTELLHIYVYPFRFFYQNRGTPRVWLVYSFFNYTAKLPERLLQNATFNM